MDKNVSEGLAGLGDDQILHLLSDILAEGAIAAVRALRGIANDPAVASAHRSRAAEILLNRAYAPDGLPAAGACAAGEPIVLEYRGEDLDDPEGARAQEAASLSPPPEALVTADNNDAAQAASQAGAEWARELLEGGCDAARALLAIVRDPEQPPGARCRAAEAILKRARGRGSPLIPAVERPVDVRFKGVLAEWAG